jgi:hypothetical protein
MDAAKCTKARGNESDYGKKEAIGTITGSSPVDYVVKGAIDQALAYFSESRTLEAKPGFNDTRTVYGPPGLLLTRSGPRRKRCLGRLLTHS